MARRQETDPLQKVTMNLYDGDFARLSELYPSLGAGKIVRELVRAHLTKIEVAARIEEPAWQTSPNSSPEILLHLPEKI